MARIVASVKSELSSWLTSLGAGEVSREFFDLIKAIGEAHSKHEEQAIIEGEARALRQHLRTHGLATDDARLIRELLVRLMYCEILGVHVAFGYMVAINLMQMRARLIDKRVGYLAASLFLHPQHELVTLCINSFRRDLQSENAVEVSMALTAVTRLLNADGIPALLPDIRACCAHADVAVRKKAVTVVARLLAIDRSHAAELADTLRRALCDSEPTVMAAALGAYLTLFGSEDVEEPERAEAARELVPSLVSILKQIVEHALPRDYDYARVPAPWLQVRLLRLIGVLCRSDRTASENAYEVLMDTLRRADVLALTTPAASAIVYECARTAAQLHPLSTLLDACAASVAPLLDEGRDRNARYVGLQALLALVAVAPQYALPHQRAVLACLQDPDTSLQRVTLRLLHAMANRANAATVIDQFLERLRRTHTHDEYTRRDLVTRALAIAEAHAPDDAWYVRTLLRLIVLGGDLVEASVAYNLLLLLAEDSGVLRTEAFQLCLRLAARPTLPSLALRVVTWTLGEFGASLGATEAMDAVLDLFARPSPDTRVRVWLLAALGKLLAQAPAAANQLKPTIEAVLDRFSHSHSAELQQRACELSVLLAAADTHLLQRALPEDASTEDLQVSPQLPMLDSWVQAQVTAGRVPSKLYRKPAASRLARARRESGSGAKALKYAYTGNDATPAAPSTERSIYNDAQPSTASTVQAPAWGTLGGQGGWGSSGWAGASGLKVASARPELQTDVTSIPLAKQSPALLKKELETTVTVSAQAPSPSTRPPAPTKEDRLAAQLFGGLGAAPSTVSRTARTVRAPARAGARGESRPEASLLGDVSLSAPAPPSRPEPTSAPSLSLLDSPPQRFAGGLLSQRVASDDYSCANLDPPLPPIAREALLSRANDVHVRAALVPSSDEALRLIILVSNASSAAVEDINLTLTVPSALAVATDAAAPAHLSAMTLTVGADSTPHRLRLATLPPQATAAATVLLRLKSRELPQHLTLSVAGSVCSLLSVSHVRATLAVSALDWLTGLPLSIDAYAKAWGSGGRESKLQARVHPATPADLAPHLAPFHVASIKGQEIIAAAQTLTPPTTTILLYAKLSPPHISLAVRSDEQRTSEAAVNALRARLAAAGVLEQ